MPTHEDTYPFPPALPEEFCWALPTRGWTALPPSPRQRPDDHDNRSDAPGQGGRKIIR